MELVYSVLQNPLVLASPMFRELELEFIRSKVHTEVYYDCFWNVQDKVSPITTSIRLSTGLYYKSLK